MGKKTTAASNGAALNAKAVGQRWGGRFPSAGDVQDQKKLEMLKAAALFFSNSGYHSTSLKDVAESIGITKSLLYYYFKDKQELLYECSLMAHTKIQFEFPEYSSKREYIRALVASMVSYIETINEHNLQFVMFMEPDVLRRDQLLAINRLRDKYESTLRRILAEGQELGVIIPADVKILGFSLLGSVNWVARWWRRDGERPLRDLATQLVHVAVRGLMVQPRTLDTIVVERHGRDEHAGKRPARA